MIGGATFRKSKDDEIEIIEQLKEKFHSTSESSVKVQVLTESWSIRKIQTEFEASNFMARKAKQLVKEKGILSTPDPKPGHGIAQKTIELVVGFMKVTIQVG